MDNDIRQAERLAKLLDTQFNFLGFRFGLDPIIGLVPGLGDALPLIFSVYVIGLGLKYRLPQEKIARMVINAAADFAVGFVPLIGDLGDFVIKSHIRNIEIIKEHRSRERVVR